MSVAEVERKSVEKSVARKHKLRLLGFFLLCFAVRISCLALVWHSAILPVLCELVPLSCYRLYPVLSCDSSDHENTLICLQISSSKTTLRI